MVRAMLIPWRVFQATVFAAFVFSNIYFEWEISGLAAGVMGGMLAWYLSVIIARVLWRLELGWLTGLEEAPSISLLYRPTGLPVEPQRKSRRPVARP